MTKEIETQKEIEEEDQEMTVSEILEEQSTEAYENHYKYNEILQHMAQIAGLIAKLMEVNERNMG